MIPPASRGGTCRPHDRAGYLLEVRLLAAAALFLIAFLLPLRRDHPVFVGIAVIACSAALLACGYYMILTPGWRPGARPLPPPWNYVAFSLLALALAAGTLLILS